MTRKEKITALVRDEKYTPLSPEDIAARLKVPEKSMGKFNDIISELIREGVIIISKKGLVAGAERSGLIKGVLRVNPRGFGFLIRDDGGEDIHINSDSMYGAINGDSVLVRLKPAKAGARPEGTIDSVLEHSTQRVVGTLHFYSGLGIVTPDDEHLPREIFIPARSSRGEDGQKVLVKITEYLKDGSLRGIVEEVLGYPDDFGVDVLSIIKGYGFRIDFPKKVADEARAVPDALSEADLSGRLDLRSEKIITIDGDDSKDLDDAISLTKTENGYRLGVHIADVSHYVLPGSATDKEALSRGTSVYLVDRVIPMLPPRLSNGICSLNQGEDRLTMSVFMDMDFHGNVLKSEFYKSVIKSTHRMTYNNVWKLLQGDAALEKEYANVAPMLRDMYALSLKLRDRAVERGYLELDIPEAKAVLDENGHAIDIELRKINGANELIEQFMVSANMEVAKYLWNHNCPAIYRVHGSPSEEKLSALRKFTAGLGYNPNMSLKELLCALEDEPEKEIVAVMILRSMAKAMYSPANSGHYGLGAENYCHFTSPIRRYPDLVCHRALKAALEKDDAALRRIARMNADAAEDNSERELAAEKCERDTLDLKKAEYMEQFVGQEFYGMISSVTAFGFFVVLPNTVEGLVPVNSLSDDYYVYDEETLTLRGERLHHEYRVGDSVEVLLVSANKQSRKIEFVVKGLEQKNKPKPEKKESAKHGGSSKRNKNSRAKQKRIPRVFHRRKNRGRH